MGVTMDRYEDGSIELKWLYLIDWIPEALGIDTKLASNKWTPPEASPLVKIEDKDGPWGSFSRSVITVPLRWYCTCLAQSTWYFPCCQHVQSNTTFIGRYIKMTRDRGLSMKPCGELEIETYPNTHFTGLYRFEKSHNLSCTKIRTRFWPIFWIVLCCGSWNFNKKWRCLPWKRRIIHYCTTTEGYFMLWIWSLMLLTARQLYFSQEKHKKS